MATKIRGRFKQGDRVEFFGTGEYRGTLPSKLVAIKSDEGGTVYIDRNRFAPATIGTKYGFMQRVAAENIVVRDWLNAAVEKGDESAKHLLTAIREIADGEHDDDLTEIMRDALGWLAK